METVKPMQLLTLEEVAEMLRKSPAQLRWMLHNGTAPKSAKIGGRRLFSAKGVQEYLEEAFEAEASQ